MKERRKGKKGEGREEEFIFYQKKKKSFFLHGYIYGFNCPPSNVFSHVSSVDVLRAAVSWQFLSPSLDLKMWCVEYFNTPTDPNVENK